MRLSPDDKKYYFSLHDAFQYFSSEDKGVCPDLETLGRTHSLVELRWEENGLILILEVLRQKGCFDLKMEVAAKIIGIYNTNCVESGVCRLLSRINHSCQPPAELVTNPELETQDLRAVRQIQPGEEITANYADLEDGLNQA